MKTILVPTDFSPKAENIIDYAAALAKAVQAKLILFHVFHPPVTISEMPDVQPMDDIEETCLINLRHMAEKIRNKYGQGMQIDCKCQCGFAVDEIQYFQENNKIDLIVMGMRGAGYLSERLIGSITTSLIYKSKYPVLAIADKVIFKPIKKIVLACDFVPCDHEKILKPLKDMAQMLGAHIYILNVVHDAEKMVSIHDSAAGNTLTQALQGTEHSVHYSKNRDIVDGINEFIHTHDIDLAVMIPRTHTLLENIFQEPNTKRMAFHADVPLLSLHEV